VEAGRARESRIEAAIERADLPYGEVSDEVERFIAAMDGSAARAQLLYEALSESPPEGVEQSLLQAEGDPSRSELAAALRNQLSVLRRMEGQLQRFYDEMQRMLVELDTVRASLVSVSASSEAANQEKLAAEVRGLRDELGAVAEGMSEAYESPARP
jgi:ParB-like chromosome segregation protein Spo0J